MKKLTFAIAAVLALAFAAPAATACPGMEKDKVSDDQNKAADDTTAEKKPAKGDKAKKADKTDKAKKTDQTEKTDKAS